MPETDSTTVSSLGSRFELFVDLGAVDTASIPSRALLSCPIKESGPMFPHKARAEQRGLGEMEAWRLLFRSPAASGKG
jgi:hypothetical protein